ncbi:hypothetical protein JZ751_025105 [Albula glossodonta]|uniref:Uncharacterized protein n=1 Tax=Albula glossodonta TaxID=121402 RepID=A0A8T2PFC8_9TELE|nr:hypothetical protein JZ751_025105 [Albula glossodonta]
MSYKACEKHHECVTSTEFLTSLQTLRQGDCPPPQKAVGFAAACVESCSVDSDCSGSKKCCSNGCGHTCQAPANLYKGVPLKPRKEMSFMEDHLGQLEVTWMSKFNVSVEPVLYVLQSRWNYGIHPSEDEATSWQTILMTMEDRTLLKDIRSHRWYQFRVTGEMELGGLLPDTAYLVQVQAVAYWGQKRLKSSKAQLSFTTPPAGSSGVPIHGQDTEEVSNELPSSHSTLTVLRLEAASPHYHNNQLQVKGTHFVITGLLFACKYRVTVTSISRQGQRSEAVTFVTTPQCSAVKGRGFKLVSCTKEERHPLARKAQLRPERLSAVFHTVNGSLQGLFSWQVSQNAPVQASIAGFQFSWAQVSSSSASAVSDTLISQTQILAPDQHSLTVENLQPESIYKVQVQALSAGGTGPSVAFVPVFHPQLTLTPVSRENPTAATGSVKKTDCKLNDVCN